MRKNSHTAVWFEIPVGDLDRAVAFYSKMLEVELHVAEYGPTKMAVFPGSGGEASEAVVHGALVLGEGYDPGPGGTLLYLNGGEDLSGPLSRVEAAGGKVILPKTPIGEHGFMAWFIDAEGNRLALHSPT